MDTGPLAPKGKAGQGVTLTIQPHLAPRLKTQYGYISIPLLGLQGLLWGEFYLYLYLLPYCAQLQAQLVTNMV